MNKKKINYNLLLKLFLIIFLVIVLFVTYNFFSAPQNATLINKVKKELEKKEIDSYIENNIIEMIPSFKKVLTDEQIINIIQKIKGIDVIYNRENSETLAYNDGEIIYFNLENNKKIDDLDKKYLKYLLAHEMFHFLGIFPNESLSELTFSIIPANNLRLEEGLADFFAYNITDYELYNSIVLTNKDPLILFTKGKNNNLVFSNYPYSISYNIIWQIYQIDCINELIQSNIDTDWTPIKKCIQEKTDDKTANEFLNYIDKINLFLGYPNSIYTGEQIKKLYKNDEAYKIADNNNLYDLLIEFNDFSIDILKNKYEKYLKQNNYSKKAIEEVITKLQKYEKNALILVSNDNGKTYTNEKYNKLLNDIKLK